MADSLLKYLLFLCKHSGSPQFPRLFDFWFYRLEGAYAVEWAVRAVDARVDEIHLEMASREMAELPRISEVAAAGKDVAVVGPNS